MTVLPIIATLAIVPTLVGLERWLAGAVRRDRTAPAEDRLFRNGLRMLLRGSATLALGAACVGTWRSLDALPQPGPGLFEGLPLSLAILIAMIGGGQMASGLLLAHWRFRQHRYMDAGLSLLILVLLGGGIALATSLPFAVAWIASQISA